MVAQDEDDVRILDGRDALGDNDLGAAEVERAQFFLYGTLRLKVHGGGRVVQNQHARPLGEGACEGDALLLPAGEAHAAFADERVISVGEF